MTYHYRICVTKTKFNGDDEVLIKLDLIREIENGAYMARLSLVKLTLRDSKSTGIV